MFLYEEDRKKEEHAVKILFYDTKSYDKESFEAKAKDYPDIQIEYLKSELVPSTAKLAKGYDAICAFVSSDVGTETIDVLSACGVKLILMRVHPLPYREQYGPVPDDRPDDAVFPVCHV